MNLRPSQRWWAGLGTVVVTTALVAPASAFGASRPSPGSFTAESLSPESTIEAAKSPSGRLAQSDPALLKRTDSARISVMVKLDYDASASYRGDVDGLAATSPAVTGRKLTGRSAAEVAYAAYTGAMERAFRSALAAKVPTADAGLGVQTVYGGVQVTLPANQAKALLDLPGVAAVQLDAVNKPAALPEGPQFIGAPTIWNQTGGQSLAGKGVIFADLDTGIWPEHPMLADNAGLGAPPAAPSGKARECNYGDNPLTPEVDVFVCNHKVIGGAWFTKTYESINPTTELYPKTARDSGGHGTHTTTTAAGNPVASAKVFGVERGPVSGVAPGAWVMEYKVCGVNGCYGSDTTAAVQQAILDGANVINYSISGGSSPYSDPTELAFLDAYNAGVFVAASAGNSGPGASTTDHRSPWVTTVAASTQTREFQSTLTVSDGAASATFVGASIMGGVATPTPVVLAQNIPGYDALCSTALPAGAADGKIVACRRGVIGRVQKGFNVKAGGAVGMILYNQPLQDIETDNHFLPVVHLADGTAFLAFMAAHPTASASFTAGVAAAGQGDVMAAFSSRGPGGTFLKPDITAPGVQVLAGLTPTPDEVASGPSGEYYQAIAGTSMSAPHIAGSAILMKALHPTWTPGAIKSAMMTTAITKVVKEDLVTPATPFDDGAGRVDLTVAGKAALVFDESASRMAALGNNPLTALDLNLPSVNIPTMPGTVTVRRTAKNLSSTNVEYKVSTTAPAGSRISVSPTNGTLKPGQSQTFTITVTSSAAPGQYFGEIRLATKGSPSLHLPVAFTNKQGDVTLTQSCGSTALTVGSTTDCTVTAQNNSPVPATVTVTSNVTDIFKITAATNATVDAQRRTATASKTLAPPKDAIPTIAPIADGDTPSGGFLDLAAFGIAPTPIGDEAAQNYAIPAFVFGGKTYNRIGVVSDGYLVIGGANGNADISYLPQNLPNLNRPNGVLSPYWSDLDGTGDAGIRIARLSGGGQAWIAVQWNVHVFGALSQTRTFQVWIGLNGSEDITYTFAPDAIGANTLGNGLTVGVENLSGTNGAMIGPNYAAEVPPAGSYVITSTPGLPGESLTSVLTILGKDAGSGTLTSTLTSDQTPGTTRVVTPITVSE